MLDAPRGAKTPNRHCIQFVMKKVSGPQVVTAAEASELPLLSLSVGVGLTVVHRLMELEVDEVVGPKGKWNPDWTAKRHGREDGSMTLGGRRVEVSRPRMRTADDKHELPVESYEYFADRDPLTRAVMDRMLAGVSTRKFAVVGEPVGEEVEQQASSTGKSRRVDQRAPRPRLAKTVVDPDRHRSAHDDDRHGNHATSNNGQRTTRTAASSSRRFEPRQRLAFERPRRATTRA